MSAWDASRRILAVRLDAMGDVLLTTPAIRAIRAARPDAMITLLTSPAGAAIAKMVPEIDAVIAYEAPWMKAGDGHPPGCDRDMIDQLRGGAFDAAIVFTVFSQNPLPAAMLCYLADIPLVLAHSRERAYRLLSDAVDDPEPDSGIRHEVRRQLDLVATRGWHVEDERMSLAVSGEARAAARRLLASLAPSVLIHPGASAPSRCYPPDAFGEVARLLGMHGIHCAIVVGPDEKDLLGPITRVAPDATVVVPASLAELVALIAEAPLIVANNSGPAHIAAAVGTPIVSLYAATNPQHTPWMVPSRVLTAPVPCAWCYRSVCPEVHGRCLADIEPAHVVAAALALLAENAPRLNSLTKGAFT